MTVFRMDVSGIDRLQNAMQNYQGNTEQEINEVLHNEASPLMQEAITRLMPTSGKTWKGKKAPAKTSKSLRDDKGNLSITVRTTKNYQYLYFPDDGSSTTRHVGNQQFFFKGGETVQDEVVDRCVNRLVTNLNNL